MFTLKILLWLSHPLDGTNLTLTHGQHLGWPIVLSVQMCHFKPNVFNAFQLIIALGRSAGICHMCRNRTIFCCSFGSSNSTVDQSNHLVMVRSLVRSWPNSIQFRLSASCHRFHPHSINSLSRHCHSDEPKCSLLLTSKVDPFHLYLRLIQASG